MLLKKSTNIFFEIFSGGVEDVNFHARRIKRSEKQGEKNSNCFSFVFRVMNLIFTSLSVWDYHDFNFQNYWNDFEIRQDFNPSCCSRLINILFSVFEDQNLRKNFRFRLVFLEFNHEVRIENICWFLTNFYCYLNDESMTRLTSSQSWCSTDCDSFLLMWIEAFVWYSNIWTVTLVIYFRIFKLHL